MFRSNGHSRPSAAAGFTLLEVMVSTLIFGTVSVAVLGAFVFLGENMTRMANAQQLEENSRRLFYLFNQDVGKATKVDTTYSSSTNLVLTLPSTTVKYAYDSSAQTVTRYQPYTNASGTILLRNLTAFGFSYFNKAGTSVTSTNNNIKGVQFSLTSSLGSTTATGAAIYRTTSRYQTVSPIVFLRNTSTNSLLPP